MSKRKLEDLREYPDIELVANGTRYIIQNVIDWKPLELTCSLNPEEIGYMIKFICYTEDLTVRCADENEQINIMHALSGF
jgi:hypothetical protein